MESRGRRKVGTLNEYIGCNNYLSVAELYVKSGLEVTIFLL